MAYIGKAPISIAYGGTNQSTLPTNGQLLIGNSNSFTLGNLTAGSGINVTNAAGSITIASTVAPPVLSPLFIARQTTNQTDVTGDNTVYTVICDTADSNIGSAYDTTTGLFTAPDTDNYVFMFGADIQNIGAAHTLGNIQVVTGSGPVANGFYGNPYVSSVGGILQISQAVAIVVNSGDTVAFTITVSNDTKTVGVYGDATGSYTTWFAGYRLSGSGGGGGSNLNGVVDGSGNTVTPSGGLITLVNGNNVSSLSGSASHITLNLTGTSQYNLQVGNAGGSISDLGTGTPGQLLVSNGSGANPSFQSVPTVIVWNAVAGASQTLAVQNGYVNQNSGLTTFTLPGTANFGDVIEIAGMGAGGWTIVENTGQNIIVGSLTSTTTSGSISSTTANDTIRLLCTVMDTTFMALSWAGNLTVI